jgi:hypothetical protein
VQNTTTCPRLAIASLLALALACLAACGDHFPRCRGFQCKQPRSATPTYYKDIAPIVTAQCAGCHKHGGIGGFSLLDPSKATQMGQSMAAATKARVMPPMPVNNDGSCNTFKNARWLSGDEIKLIQRWANAGAPLGDPADAPSRAPDTASELTGQVVTFDIGVDYTPHPAVNEMDDYHCFIVDPGITTDTFITGFDIQPGDTRVAHHAALFALPDAKAEADAAALDAAQDGPGYTCFGAPGLNTVSLLGAWAPGGSATLFPAGTGIPYGGGRKLVLQMHYNVPATGGPFTDRSTVKFQVSDAPGLTRAIFVPVGGRQISLPPGLEHVEATGAVPLPLVALRLNLSSIQGFRAWGVFPHMHTAGRTMRAVATTPGMADQCLTDVDRWDFHWQQLWWLDEPIDIGAESTLNVTCGFDTRTRTKTTVFGEGTDDEMCFDALYLTTY